MTRGADRRLRNLDKSRPGRSSPRTCFAIRHKHYFISKRGLYGGWRHGRARGPSWRKRTRPVPYHHAPHPGVSKGKNRAQKALSSRLSSLHTHITHSN